MANLDTLKKMTREGHNIAKTASVQGGGSGDGDGTFVVNFTFDEISGKFDPDKTMDELGTAVNDGLPFIGNIGSATFTFSSSPIAFTRLEATNTTGIIHQLVPEYDDADMPTGRWLYEAYTFTVTRQS